MKIIVQRSSNEHWKAWFEDYPDEVVEDGAKYWVIFRLVITKGHLVNIEIKQI